jgi:hypothetical protein
MFLVLLLPSCGPDDSTTPDVIMVVTNTPSALFETPALQTGYPGPTNNEASLTTESESATGYPGLGEVPTPEGLLSSPPDPDRSLPDPMQDLGVVGGVLVREVYEPNGYLPVTPHALFLSPIVSTSTGTPAYLRQSSTSPKAELFATGVFIFNRVPHGEYGLVVDLGFTKFPLKDPDGNTLLITVEAGEATDLGQVFVTLPDS